MDWLVDVLILVGFIIIIAIWAVVKRKKLLQMWKEVTQYEVRFYRHLDKVIKLYYQHTSSLATDDLKECITTIRRYRKKRVRTLLLQTRQELYNAINLLYDEVEEKEDPLFDVLKQEYQTLQKIRRLYNSKVLIYNQTINVFPTRYLALRMNLEMKEYFG